MSGTGRSRRVRWRSPPTRVVLALVAVAVAVVVIGMQVLRVVQGGDEPVPEPLPTLGPE